MSKPLDIFVTSVQPDQYLNPIVHCLLQENVDKITFVYIRGFGKFGENESQLYSQSKMAYEGIYKYFAGEKKGKTVNLQRLYFDTESDALQSIYRICNNKEIKWDRVDFSYDKFKGAIKRIIKEEPNSIFDVTAVAKSLLGDFISIFMIYGIHELFTFDLRITPNFDEPWKILYHELLSRPKEEKKYESINILDTPIFKLCLRAILIRTMPIKLSLIFSGMLLFSIIAIYRTYGPDNVILQILSLVSVVAGIYSVFLALFPLKRWE